MYLSKQFISPVLIFGLERQSNLSDHDEDNINSSSTTIELDKDSRASLAKEMKRKDYN
jgi:hypothetical protein